MRKKPAGSRASAAGLWDRPELLNTIADLLLFFAAAALAWAAVTAALRLPVFPLREVVVATPLTNVTLAQLEYAARSGVVGNFFTIDLDRARAAFEKLPWVRKAELRRQWPNGLRLAIEEHVATALWRRPDGEVRLVNSHGEMFSAATGAQLPVFSGPESAAPEMFGRYAEFSQALRPLGRSLQQVSLSARLAWQLRLDDGFVIDLGRDQSKAPALERLARFVSTFPQAAEQAQHAIAAADLRYPGGYALKTARGREDLKSNR